MRIPALLRLTVFLSAAAFPATAQVTITSTNGNVMTGSGVTQANAMQTVDMSSLGGTDIPDMPTAPNMNYELLQEEDGFYSSVGDQFLTPQQQAQREKMLEEELKKREAAKTVQFYRGEEANKPKLEPKRTHRMYEQTRY